MAAHVQGFADDLHVLYDNEAIPPSGGICGTPAPIMGPDDLDPDAGPDPRRRIRRDGSVWHRDLW
ncbi:MAG: hypothetical protein CMJ51_01745 [Planctomycetaceae bacterium]|nr:hypothetical protein [Planctomycetaceae bacterium]